MCDTCVGSLYGVEKGKRFVFSPFAVKLVDSCCLPVALQTEPGADSTAPFSVLLSGYTRYATEAPEVSMSLEQVESRCM